MRALLLILLTIFLVSCAAKQTAVEFADTMIESQIERRLPLYSKQKQALKVDVDKFLMGKKKIAQDMLPILDKINLDDHSNVDQSFQKLENFYKQISIDFGKLMAKYMAPLDKKQQKDFFDVLAAENKEIESKNSTDRKHDLEAKVEKLIGTVTDGQKKFLADYHVYFDERNTGRLENRKRLHNEFRTILEQDLSVESKELMIQDAFKSYQERAFAGNRSLEIIKKFTPTMTLKQKETFREKTRELKEIIGYFIQTDY